VLWQVMKGFTGSVPLPRPRILFGMEDQDAREGVREGVVYALNCYEKNNRLLFYPEDPMRLEYDKFKDVDPHRCCGLPDARDYSDYQ
jgi:hypothetical protein